MNNPLVSIVIPIYNEEKYLDKCLSSLFNQTYINTEIIVVDDGSFDKSREICQKYSVKLLPQKHKGPGVARNRGAKDAKGEILVFADADMRFDEHYIECLTMPIREGKAVGTFNKDERVANSNNIWAQCWAINSGLPVTRRLPEDYPEKDKAFRAILRDRFEHIGGYAEDVGYGEDSSISRKLGLKAVNAKKAISYHYNPESLKEVFYSARWIGRSNIFFKQNISNFLRYSFLNSLRVSMKYIIQRNAPFAIIPFKLVYDAGMMTGIFFRFGKHYK